MSAKKKEPAKAKPNGQKLLRELTDLELAEAYMQASDQFSMIQAQVMQLRTEIERRKNV